MSAEPRSPAASGNGRVGENLVRDLHDLAATSENPAQASLRSSETTRRQLRAMRRDVLRKLKLRRGMSVAELGCGTCLLGVPIAKRCRRYVGLDFAPRAVGVANERLTAAGAASRARALCVDVLGEDDRPLRELGQFDRVLVYAVLQCMRSEDEGVRFLQRALDLLAPGGRALVGSLPLADLHADWTPPDPPPHGLWRRLRAAARWLLTPGSTRVPLTRRWKLRWTLERILRTRLQSPIGDFPATHFPAGYTVALDTALVERWLAALAGPFEHHWELPAPGAALAIARADLIVTRKRA